MKTLIFALTIVALSTTASAAETVTLPVDRPELQPGDTWEYQRVDLAGGNQTTDTQTITVKQKNADGYTIGVNETPGFAVTPPQSLSVDLGWKKMMNGQPTDSGWLQFPLSSGKNWKSHEEWISQNGYPGHDDIKYEVIGTEDVTVPAGKFKAVKVQGSGFWATTHVGCQATR